MATATLDIPLGADLTEEDARAIYARGEEAVVFAILELAKRLAEQKAGEASQSHQTPATPSGMKPPFSKSAVSGAARRIRAASRGIQALDANLRLISIGKSSIVPTVVPIVAVP